MALHSALQKLLRESSLSFEEVRAFEAGLSMLTLAEQTQFYEQLAKDPELIYPIYIHFKAKAKAIRGTDAEWREAVENEVKELEAYIAKKRVGEEIA